MLKEMYNNKFKNKYNHQLIINPSNNHRKISLKLLLQMSKNIKIL